MKLKFLLQHELTKWKFTFGPDKGLIIISRSAQSSAIMFGAFATRKSAIFRPQFRGFVVFELQRYLNSVGKRYLNSVGQTDV